MGRNGKNAIESFFQQIIRPLLMYKD
ncbi:hypothetical protein [Okeania sp. SIO2B3]